MRQKKTDQQNILKRFINRSLYFGLATFFCFSSCQIYQSPDRRDFESDRPVLQVQSQQHFIVQNYRAQSCGPESVQAFSEKSEVVYVDESIRVTQYTIGTTTIYESENQQGDYCVLVQ